jgi:hypothetical protein
MNKLIDDLYDALTPVIIYLDSKDFENEEDRQEYIRTHPAKKKFRCIDWVESNGEIRWRRKEATEIIEGK